MTAAVPPEIRQEIDLEFAVSNRIEELMKKYGFTKLQLAQKLGKRPSEITKWLSGQHNFTLRTIAQLSAFFGEPLVWA
ncbi:MAG: helix-turn-helix transcriptional regulator [Bacteroidales bacterium]|nr:helix-turn-helix transcriptional regulator [Bacteroidales bacterium]